MQCTQSFICLGSLKEHGVIHSADKPFTCKQCAKDFTCSRSLKMHKVIYSEINPSPVSNVPRCLLEFDKGLMVLMPGDSNLGTTELENNSGVVSSGFSFLTTTTNLTTINIIFIVMLHSNHFGFVKINVIETLFIQIDLSTFLLYKACHPISI